jgi:hypothetical protein
VFSVDYRFHDCFSLEEGSVAFYLARLRAGTGMKLKEIAHRLLQSQTILNQGAVLEVTLKALIDST